MVQISEYRGALIVEYYSDEQWRLLNLNAPPQNEAERETHKQLVLERFDVFRQVRRMLGGAGGE